MDNFSRAANAEQKGEEGELSLFATEVVQLSPSLHLLPGERAGFTDGEKRFRMRYLDFMFNDKSREVLWQRSRIVKYIRDFFHEREFVGKSKLSRFPRLGSRLTLDRGGDSDDECDRGWSHSAALYYVCRPKLVRS